MKYFIFLFILFTNLSWADSDSIFGNPFLPEHSLPNKKDYLLKRVKEKLARYQPSQIEISYGESPRKLIKNVIVYYNGYYELSFRSGIDGLKYNCDLNHGSGSYPGMNEYADIYILNCKSENDSLLFPTHLERIFREQFPFYANNEPVKFTARPVLNTLNNITLMDEWNYEVEFSNKRNERQKCNVRMMYEKLGQETMVDQQMELSDCRKTFYPRPIFSKDIDKKRSFECFEAPSSWGEINKSLAWVNNLYDFYASDLNNKWPLPKESEVDCSNNDVAYWKSFADQMISLERVKFKTRPKRKSDIGNQWSDIAKSLETSQEVKLEKSVIENALINQAYNRLFMKFRKKKSYNYLQWLAIASHSSPIVGRTLRSAYFNNIEKGVFEASKGFKVIRDQDIKMSAHVPDIVNFFEKRTDVAEMVGTGNKNVFKDMFWQNFAAAYCGPQKAKSLNEDLFFRFKASGDKEKAKHHKELWGAWRLITEGMSSTPVDQEKVFSGNINLLRVEQKDILQEQMYDGIEAKLVGKLGLFNSIAKAGFYDKSGKKLKTFTEFSKEIDRPDNLSDLDTRLNWMEYVAAEQINYVNKSEEANGLKLMYSMPLYESYIILNDY